jgi:hypothetical protein
LFQVPILCDLMRQSPALASLDFTSTHKASHVIPCADTHPVADQIYGGIRQPLDGIEVGLAMTTTLRSLNLGSGQMSVNGFRALCVVGATHRSLVSLDLPRACAGSDRQEICGC